MPHVKSVLAIFVAAALVSLWPATAAAAQNGGRYIGCPVDQVRAEITTTLPDPWWQTPQVGKLKTTTIQNVGGRRTLMCLYHAYAAEVAVMREQPADVKACKPAKGGFLCR